MARKKDKAQPMPPQDINAPCVVDRMADLITERLRRLGLNVDQPGYSVRDFHRDFPDGESIVKLAESLRWPDGARCPRCELKDVKEASAGAPMPYYCKSCRQKGKTPYFSVTVGTDLESTKLDGEKLGDLLYFIAAQHDGISAPQLATYVGNDKKTVLNFRHDLQDCLPGGACHEFAGPTELDESYPGGSESNRHKKDRRDVRGRQGKAIVLGAFNRATGHVRLDMVERADTETSRAFVRTTVVLGSRIFTDGYCVYRKLEGYLHEWVNHTKGEYARGDVHINNVEALFDRLDRALYPLRGVEPERLPGYLHEIQWLRNLADRPLLVRVGVLLALLLGVKLPDTDSLEQEHSGAETGAELVEATDEKAAEGAEVRLPDWGEDDQAGLSGAGEQPQRTAPPAATNRAKEQRQQQPGSEQTKATAAGEIPQDQQPNLLGWDWDPPKPANDSGPSGRNGVKGKSQRQPGRKQTKATAAGEIPQDQQPKLLDG